MTPTPPIDHVHYYRLNWKTPSTYANSCKTMRLDLAEGVPHTADFQFEK